MKKSTMCTLLFGIAILLGMVAPASAGIGGVGVSLSIRTASHPAASYGGHTAVSVGHGAQGRVSLGTGRHGSRVSFSAGHSDRRYGSAHGYVDPGHGGYSSRGHGAVTIHASTRPGHGSSARGHFANSRGQGSHRGGHGVYRSVAHSRLDGHGSLIH